MRLGVGAGAVWPHFMAQLSSRLLRANICRSQDASKATANTSWLTSSLFCIVVSRALVAVVPVVVKDELAVTVADDDWLVVTLVETELDAVCEAVEDMVELPVPVPVDDAVEEPDVDIVTDPVLVSVWLPDDETVELLDADAVDDTVVDALADCEEEAVVDTVAESVVLALLVALVVTLEETSATAMTGRVSPLKRIVTLPVWTAASNAPATAALRTATVTVIGFSYDRSATTENTSFELTAAAFPTAVSTLLSNVA